MQARFEAPLDMTANTLLDARIPLRISVQTAQGPLIVPLWFEWDGARFWCASQKDAAVVRALGREQLCAFDLSTNEMPYRGLRGRGRVRCRPERGVAVLERLIDRYLPDRRSPLAAWLLSRSANEVAIEITPTWQTTWDYSARMSDLS
jgi:nitroimidazol reductase NimA-like FMN-containing flavoprotein (pyridoxamine 5'-phosphate oxidase superfamily)